MCSALAGASGCMCTRHTGACWPVYEAWQLRAQHPGLMGGLCCYVAGALRPHLHNPVNALSGEHRVQAVTKT